MFNKRRFWLGILITVFFLFLFLFRYRSDFGQIGKALAEADYLFVLPAMLVYFVGVYFRAIRWRYLLLPLGKFAPHRLFSLVVIGFTVNNILPGRLGIVARAYLLGEKEGISKMAAGATLVLEQILDALALLLFLVITLIFVPLPDWARTIAVIVSIMFVGLLIVLVAVASSRKARSWAERLLLRLFPARWGPKLSLWLELFVSGLGVLRNPGGFLVTLLASVMVWLCEAAVFYLLSFSFNMDQPFYVFMLATAAGNLAWALLVSPGGVGPFDYFVQQTFTYFGVAGTVATAYVALLHALLLIPVIAAGLVFLWMANLSLSEVLGRKKEGKVPGYVHPSPKVEADK